VLGLEQKRQTIFKIPNKVLGSISFLPSSVRSVLGRSFAFASKDLRLLLRFKIAYMQNLFFPALTNLGLFGTVFFGFLYSSGTGVGEVTGQNFIAFTLLGTLCATLFATGFQAYSSRFMNEKYWQTMPTILASPLSSLEMLVGVTLSDLLRFSAVAAVFLVLSYIFAPVALIVLVETILLLILMYFLISGLALIRGALILVNENVDSFFNYFIFGTGYLSCFYFPLSFVPSILQPFAVINPLYFVVYSIRASWLGYSLSITYPLLGILAVVVSVLIGTFLFNKIWRNLDITGY
jgi:ABC-type multidrug transport system permease subunit